ncbi:MAG: hypothetical protein ACK521_07625 [bacterium]|jgi:hypothetical protein
MAIRNAEEQRKKDEKDENRRLAAAQFLVEQGKIKEKEAER